MTICAHNEGRNMAKSLGSILGQNLDGFLLNDIVVVSSGSTDDTDDVVRSFESSNSKVRLLVQQRREGKNSAINLALSSIEADIMVMVNADNVLAPGALQRLLEPFRDPLVGMVGGHPIPVNDRNTYTGFAVYMLWDMHHRLSLIHPKVGELVAFRNLGQRLPTDMQSDEDLIRMDLERDGYQVHYAPEAVVYNRGPGTVADFVRQRTRVNIGERYLMRQFGYQVPTWDRTYLLDAFLGFARDNHRVDRVAFAIALEACSRLYAMIYVLMDKGDKNVWDQVRSTKDVS